MKKSAEKSIVGNLYFTLSFFLIIFFFSFTLYQPFRAIVSGNNFPLHNEGNCINPFGINAYEVSKSFCYFSLLALFFYCGQRVVAKLSLIRENAIHRGFQSNISVTTVLPLRFGLLPAIMEPRHLLKRVVLAYRNPSAIKKAPPMLILKSFGEAFLIPSNCILG